MLKKRLFAGLLSFAFASLAFISVVHASTSSSTATVAPPPNPLTSMVRIELRDNNNNLLSFGSGVIIDPDGHILTNYATIQKWQAGQDSSFIICLTPNDTDPPSCHMRAVIVASKQSSDLALLQIREVNVNNVWISVEENKLKTHYQFPFAKLNLSDSTSENVNLGDTVNVLLYSNTGNTTVSQLQVHVSGFTRTESAGKSLPYEVKVDQKFSTANIGGAVFNASGTLVGIPTFVNDNNPSAGLFTSLPVLNGFLESALGKNYIQGKYSFILNGNLTGVNAGALHTNICPLYASVEAGLSVCKCDDGFFAVGNACIPGRNYCQAVYSKSASYDQFRKVCLCPSKNGQLICAKPTPPVVKPPVTPVKPKLIVATTTIAVIKPKTPTPQDICMNQTGGLWSTADKQCHCLSGYTLNSTKSKCVAVTLTPTSAPSLCPANASYNAKTWSCMCNVRYAKNQTNNACVLNVAPVNQQELTACAIVGIKKTHVYYSKGNAKLKNVSYKGSICFATMTQARRNKYYQAK